MCYDKALRILARMEYPHAAGRDNKQPGDKSQQHPPSKLQYESWVDRLVEKKFCHIVAAQVSTKKRSPSHSFSINSRGCT